MIMIEPTAEHAVNTGLRDLHGEEFFEGDYVRLLTTNEHSEICGRVGRVIWDQRRNSWQVITMILPNVDVSPRMWGKAVADWLNECTGEDYEILCGNDYFSTDWQPSTFFSGGVEIPLTKKADNAVYNPPTKQNKKPAT